MSMKIRHAHGAEMPGTASGLAQAAGFVLAHGLSAHLRIGLGIGIQKLALARVVRLTEVARAPSGAGLGIL